MRDCQDIFNGLKKCSNCGEVKLLDLYRRQATAKSGRKSKCKECYKVEQATPEAKEYSRVMAAKFRANNKNKLKSYNKKWRDSPVNKEKYSMRIKITADARYRMFTNEKYSNHFFALFCEGMTFDNYGEWQIDHIIPVTKWLDKGIYDLDIINSCENLQPMWKKDNLLKSNNILKDVSK